jgi:flagellar biosynthesis protein FliR
LVEADGAVNIEVSTPLLLAFLLATVRTSAWIVIVPAFGPRTMPPIAKAGLSMALAFPVAGHLASQAPAPEIGPIMAAVLMNVAAGLTLGIVTLILFTAIRGAGELIDYFGGFSLTQAYDPMALQNDSVFARMNDMLAITLLFASDGYLIIVKGLLNSYDAFPLHGVPPLTELQQLVTQDVGTFMVSAMEIAGPLLAVLVLTDVGLGLLTKAAPALNVFMLGFPLKIFITLSLVGITFVALPEAVSALLDKIVHNTDVVSAVFSTGGPK